MRKPDGVCYSRDGRGASPLELLARGPAELNDLELLAAVLGDAPEGANRLELAASLLDGSPAALLRRVSPRRLRALAGPERAARLLASLELGRRALTGGGTAALSSPRHVQEYARPYATAPKEHFLTIHLNARHVPLLLEVVSVGTLSASLVHPREVFRRAIAENCACLILVHNHPSGDPAPSPDDIEITTRLTKVGELVGIEVLDHVILAQERYFSFREAGMLTGAPG
jgi:DNA repair protein RadC